MVGVMLSARRISLCLCPVRNGIVPDLKPVTDVSWRLDVVRNHLWMTSKHGISHRSLYIFVKALV